VDRPRGYRRAWLTVRARRLQRAAGVGASVVASVAIVAAVVTRRALPDLLSFAGLACAPAAAGLAFGLAAALAVGCPVLIVAGHALRPEVSSGAARG
jgi:hypothetical protein